MASKKQKTSNPFQSRTNRSFTPGILNNFETGKPITPISSTDSTMENMDRSFGKEPLSPEQQSKGRKRKS
ncbi:MAG TPA: hypothetical protein VM888_09935 [Chitinophagaceae bacterium]|nr:hypothetical protein [Chitinophagaceae bacterium]